MFVGPPAPVMQASQNLRIWIFATISCHQFSSDRFRNENDIIRFLPNSFKDSVAIVNAITDVIPANAALVPEAKDTTDVDANAKMKGNGKTLCRNQLLDEPGQVCREEGPIHRLLENVYIAIANAKA